jgi:WD40 repeat protein
MASAPPTADAPRKAEHDAFISHSRKDRLFAQALEKALENFRPPKDLPLEQRRLAIFRDEADFTGVAYDEAVERHLRNSAALIVVCSPDAAASAFVNDEIRRFVGHDPAGRRDKVIPLLYRGLPNNEAPPGREQDRAFPEALCELMGIPLGVNYIGFDPRRDKPDKGRFMNAWYSTLANLYGVGRALIEERDRRREARTRQIRMGIGAGVVVALSTALVYALVSRHEAVSQREIADRRRAEAERQTEIANRATEAERKATEHAQESAREANLARELEKQQREQAEHNAAEARRQQGISLARQLSAQASTMLENQLDLAALLAVESYRRHPSAGAAGSLFQVLQFRPYVRSILHHGAKDLAFNAEGTVLATCDQSADIVVWDLSQTWPRSRILSHPGSEFTAVGLHPTREVLISGTEDGSLLFWDLKSGHVVLERHEVHKDGVTSITVNRTGTIIASAGRSDGDVLLWSGAGGSPLVNPVLQHGGYVWSADFSPDGKQLVTAGSETIKLWDVESRRLTHTAQNGSDYVYRAIFSPGGQLIASAGGDRAVRLWDASLKPAGEPMTGHTDFLLGLAFSADGSRLVSGGRDGRLLVWDVAGRKAAGPPLIAHKGFVLNVAARPNSGGFVSASNDGKLLSWDLPGAAPLNVGVRFDPHIQPDIVALNQAGSLLAASSLEGVIQLVNTLDGSMSRTGLYHPGTRALAFNPAGSILASGSLDGTVALWDLTKAVITGERFYAGVGRIAGLSFSRDGKQLAIVAGGNGEIDVWDVATRTPAGIRFPGLGRETNNIAIDQDWRIAVVPDPSRASYSVWDIREGKQLGAPVAAHGKQLDSVALSRDGKLLATAGANPATLLWDVAERVTIGSPFLTDALGGWSIAISGDGKRMATGFGDPSRAQLSLWDTDVDSWLEKACRLANRNLTALEWRQHIGDEPYRQTCPGAPAEPYSNWVRVFQ